MTRLNGDPNALRGTHEEGILDRLNKMNTKLEEIQKSLDMYLEVKRQIFPRFYFLSNDDLLEILGQSRNPEAVGFVYRTHCMHMCMYVRMFRTLSYKHSRILLYVHMFQLVHAVLRIYVQYSMCILNICICILV